MAKTKRTASSAPALMWFRRDLRLADNPALEAAAQGGRAVTPVFILEDEPPVRAPGAAALWWLDKSLQALAASLEARGSRLILRRGRADEVLAALVEETGAKTVAWSRAYEPPLDARDAALADELRSKGVEVLACPGKLLLEPDAVRTKAGGAYGVFSPFWRAATAQLPSDAPLATPRRLAAPPTWPSSEPLGSWGLHPSRPDWSQGFDWTPGEEGAHAGLHAFLNDRLVTYPHDRDRPAVDGSSRLSPHLAWGEISPRQLRVCVQARLAAHGLEHAVEKFLAELGWREFDYGLLAQQPELNTAPFKPNALKGLKWRNSASDLQAWKEGRTGYPIVDAGMRQLWNLGWMHNRVRLITSSFLVKHLLIDWREGERWFWDCLVDADPANNPANWQWIAGTGADAQPFFRIFAPVTQGEKFDADGDYVRFWIPELAKADRRWIHAPWTATREELAAAGVRLGLDYPHPIVRHEDARTRALAALQATRPGARDGGGPAPAQATAGS